MENEKHPLDDLKNDEITEKREKMRNTHFRTCNMARKTEKVGKVRNVHCGTWNLARKLKIMENGKHPLDDLKNT